MTATDPEHSQFVRTLREQVTGRIRHEVLCDRLPAGQVLREADLAARFGVSRGPVRDALLTLANEGWVELAAHRGCRVAAPAGPDLAPLLRSLRFEIEADALRRVFGRLTAEDFARWDGHLAAMRAACAGGDLAGIAAADVALHRALVDRPGLPPLVPIWMPLVARVRFPYTLRPDLAEVYRRHVRLIDAFRGPDLGAAVRELRDHVSPS
jgi:DNA-binding GntR family transcriptional regulator